MSKKSFYCWYLGFTEAYGQQGQNRIYDLIKNLVNYQNNKSGAIPPSKVTLHLSEKSMTIIDSNINTSNTQPNKRFYRKQSSAKDQKTYTIAYDHITFVGRLADPQYSDILTCIVRNENLATRITTFYLHAFRCDCEETSKKMEQYLNYFRRLYFKKLEKQQMKAKENFLRQNRKAPPENIVMKKNEQPTQPENSKLKENFIKRQMFKITDHFNHQHESLNSSGGTRSSASQNDLSSNSLINSPPKATVINHEAVPKPRAQSPTKDYIYDNIHREITGKLEAGEPFLFPPKDYSDIHLKRGNLSERENRRCLNEKIVGELALKQPVKKQQVIHEDNEPENELYLNLSSTSAKIEAEINTARSEPNTDRSIDFNSLSFNEQATQVLNYLDEVVDSVDSIYKPPIPIDSNRNMYKYEPPEEEVYDDLHRTNTFYEPYEPLEDNNTNYQATPKLGLSRHFNKNENNVKKVESPRLNKSNFKTSFMNKTPLEDYSTRTKMNNQSKNMKIESENPSGYTSAANNGVRGNALPVLGNYTPKMYSNGMASASIVQSSGNQVIYRRIDNINNNNKASNKENNFQKMQHHTKSDESIYKKPADQFPENRIYETTLNQSLSHLNEEPGLANKSGLRRTNKDTGNVYVSQPNYNSQFILKPTNPNSTYVHVEDLKNYPSSSTAAAGTVINIYPSPDFERSRESRKAGNITARSYDIHDIYY